MSPNVFLEVSRTGGFVNVENHSKNYIENSVKPKEKTKNQN
jgi:hypothetical protein